MLVTDDLKDAIAEMSLEELSAIQNEIRTAKKKKYQRKGKILHGYVGEEYNKAIPVVIEYLHEHNFIQSKTVYNLVKLSVELVIDDILGKMRNGYEKSNNS